MRWNPMPKPTGSEMEDELEEPAVTEPEPPCTKSCLFTFKIDKDALELGTVVIVGFLFLLALDKAYRTGTRHSK